MHGVPDPPQEGANLGTSFGTLWLSHVDIVNNIRKAAARYFGQSINLTLVKWCSGDVAFSYQYCSNLL